VGPVPPTQPVFEKTNWSWPPPVFVGGTTDHKKTKVCFFPHSFPQRVGVVVGVGWWGTVVPPPHAPLLATVFFFYIVFWAPPPKTHPFAHFWGLKFSFVAPPPLVWFFFQFVPPPPRKNDLSSLSSQLVGGRFCHRSLGGFPSVFSPPGPHVPFFYIPPHFGLFFLSFNRGLGGPFFFLHFLGGGVGAPSWESLGFFPLSNGGFSPGLRPRGSPNLPTLFVFDWGVPVWEPQQPTQKKAIPPPLFFLNTNFYCLPGW